MSSNFTVRLLGRIVSIEKHTTHDGATPQSWGRSYLHRNIVFVDTSPGNPVLRIAIHELLHQYLYYSGCHRDYDANEEQSCELFGAFMESLVNENGPDIIEKIYNWLNDVITKEKVGTKKETT